MYGLEEPRLRRSAGGLLKESPKPPRTFLECMIGGAAAHACFRGKTLPDAADTVSAVSGIRLPPECRFCWDCKRRKQFNAGVPGAVAPGKTNLWSPPSRWEERSASAGRGDGGRKEREGSVGRRQRRQALPFGTAVAGRAGNQPDKPPARVPVRQGQPVPLGFIPGDARGEAPCIK